MPSPLSVPIQKLLDALQVANQANPVDTFRLALMWINRNVAVVKCSCGKKDCPNQDLSQLLGQINAYILRDEAREAKGQRMQGTAVPLPPSSEA